MADMTNTFSAAEQGLGYAYQPRLALLKLLQLPENAAALFEAGDDVEFREDNGRILASLKHRADGNRLTDLSTDFWKSVRIWLDRYGYEGKIASNLRFFLLTTSDPAESSFVSLLAYPEVNRHDEALVLAEEALARSGSKVVTAVKGALEELTGEEKVDFFSRVTVFGNCPRIEDIPDLIINQHMRIVRREFRLPVYERLEGWWNMIVIDLLAGKRTSPVSGNEVSDKLSAIADGFKADNLPIDFRGARPPGGVDAENDPRLFVAQLKEINISTRRIQSAICDYYRAFKQRSSWARENVLLEGEVEDFEERLVEEWGRYRDVIFEDLEDDSPEESLLNAGRELYKWAELETDNLRIRERVSEAYVTRGNFQILANTSPIPRVHWHPRFLQRLDEILGRATS